MLARIALCMVFALASLSIAHANTLHTIIVNPAGAPITVSSCNVDQSFESDYADAQFEINIEFAPFSSMNIQAEITYVFGDGHTFSTLYTVPSAWSRFQVTLPRYTTPVIATRCAIAYGTTDRNLQYVAPWIPLQWNRLYPVPDIPATQ